MNPTLSKILAQEKEFDEIFSSNYVAQRKSSLEEIKEGKSLYQVIDIKSFHRQSLIELLEGEIEWLKGKKIKEEERIEASMDVHNYLLDQLITHYQEVVDGLKK